METIERYRELCLDGTAVANSTGHAGAATTARWKSSTIVRLQWWCAGDLIEIEHLHGIAAQLLPDLRTVALLRASPPGPFASALEFVDARARSRVTLRSPLNLDGRDVSGEFAWFESPARQNPQRVRVVFWETPGDRYYLLDVNAADGTITAVLPLQ